MKSSAEESRALHDQSRCSGEHDSHGSIIIESSLLKLEVVILG